jgi:acyl-CoA reductase-like NAD-dependent aldehyde dehydrogenase
MQTMKMIIDGQFVESVNSERFSVNNPATGETVDTVPKGSREDARMAIDAAHEAFPKWSSTTPSERAKLLFKLAQALRDNQGDLARVLTLEQGKPLSESTGEIVRFLDLCEYYGGLAAKLRGATQNIANQSIYCDVIRQPIGVVGAIIPWNFPVSLFGFKLAPALAAGNTIVAKPASTTPLTDLKIGELVGRVGIPRGVVNIITGPGPVVGQELLDNPRVRKISFTGETGTGKHIMEACAGTVKRVTLELGGSDPMIVCNDADLDLAVEGAVWGRFRNCGQSCTAVKRLFIFEDIYDTFLKKLIEAVGRIKIGNGLDPTTLMGPLNNELQRKTIEEQVDDAKQREAKALVGGRRPPGTDFESGFFYLPTILVNVDEGSKVSKEECFGPVLPIFPTQGLEQALEIANSTSFGLGASVWTTNLSTARVAAERFEAGTVWINSPPITRIEVPFGGFKESGLGRELGPEGLDAYLETKTIQVDISGKNKTWRFFPQS